MWLVARKNGYGYGYGGCNFLKVKMDKKNRAKTTEETKMSEKSGNGRTEIMKIRNSVKAVTNIILGPCWEPSVTTCTMSFWRWRVQEEAVALAAMTTVALAAITTSTSR